MGETSDFDAAQAHAVFKKLTSDLARVFASGAAIEVGLDVPEPRKVEDAELRALIPGAAVAMGLRNDGGESSLLLILEHEAARALALGALGLDEEARAAKLAEATEPDEAERGALAEIGEKVAGAARTALGVDHATLTVDRLDNSVWESGSDPIGGGFMVVAKATLEIAGRPTCEAYIATTPELATAGGSTTDGLICFASRPELVERMLGAAGIAMRSVASLPELLANFADEAVEGAVIGVAAGDEYVLATVASLRDHPGCAAKSVVVILEETSPWNVVRCGRLGLFRVLGLEFSADDLARKLED